MGDKSVRVNEGRVIDGRLWVSDTSSAKPFLVPSEIESLLGDLANMGPGGRGGGRARGNALGGLAAPDINADQVEG